MQISNSAVDKYKQCSKMYELHYILKIRPKATSSSLVWGSAIDAGLNELLLAKMQGDLTLPTPFRAFMEKWEKTEINDVSHELKFSPLIEYSSKDLDLDLFTEEDWNLVKEEYSDQLAPNWARDVLELRKAHPWYDYSRMDSEDLVAYNFLCWISLARKARLIFRAYQEEILPRIKKVISIQDEVALVNQDGDTVKGFLDLRVIWEDGKEYILDNKTAADFSRYPEGCVNEKPQIPLYGFCTSVSHGGYIVINKTIARDKRKKESLPKVKFKVVLDKIDPVYQQKVLNEFNFVNQGIKQGIFEKKKDPKECYFYGKKCPYFDQCWKGSMEGLIKK